MLKLSILCVAKRAVVHKSTPFPTNQMYESSIGAISRGAGEQK